MSELTLAQVADLLYQTREKRYALNKAVEALEKLEGELKDRLINELPKGEASGIAGKSARVSIEVKPVPRAEDWEKVFAYVKKNNAFDLLQRRLNDAAVRERWEAGKQVPGVNTFQAVVVKINKL